MIYNRQDKIQIEKYILKKDAERLNEIIQFEKSGKMKLNLQKWQEEIENFNLTDTYNPFDMSPENAEEEQSSDHSSIKKRGRGGSMQEDEF